ncbi:unnamed protein product [Wuchereria bancrofti]|uniref:Uncharacterized protein n=1 Tax=Wuchereria bancrofti TaxID=6293 RepID=A0A3P7FXK3_WUCBA|nr:unnamed protein product [Wuchereria bancrofti]
MRKDNFDYQRNTAFRSSSLGNTACFSTSDIQITKKSSKYYYRRPTVTIQSNGRITIGGSGHISLSSP